MKLILENIKFRNFCGYGNSYTTYHFDMGLFNLFGAIGQGKSSVLSSLYYNLFGLSFSKINIGELINTTNESQLDTISSLRIGSDRFTIQRGMKPNVLIICKNDVPINQQSKKKFTQEEINKIIGMDADMFKSLVGLSATNNKSFFTLSKSDKREMMENLFGLNTIASLSTQVKNELSSLKVDIEVLQRTSVIYEQTMLEAKNQLVNFEKSKKDNEDKRQLDISNLRSEISTTTSEAKLLMKTTISVENEIKNISSNIETLLAQIKDSTAEKDIISIDKKIAIVDSKISTLNKTNDCPTCYTSITVEHRNKHIAEFTKEKEMLEGERKAISPRLAQLNEHKNSLELNRTKKNELTIELNKCKSNLSVYSSKTKELNKQIEDKLKHDFSVDVEALRESINKKIVEYGKVKGDIQNKKEDMLINQQLSTILSDNGFKASFMAKLLPVLNYKINEYLDILDFPIRIEIQPTLTEKIETLTGISKERSYHSFSGGERKIMDVSVWMAFIDSVKLFLNWDINVLFIDELFDDGTDLDTMEKIIKTLRKKTENSDLHVSLISHKNPEVKFDGKYLAKKTNGFSKLEKVI